MGWAGGCFRKNEKLAHELHELTRMKNGEIADNQGFVV